MIASRDRILATANRQLGRFSVRAHERNAGLLKRCDQMQREGIFKRSRRIGKFVVYWLSEKS